MNDAQIEQRIAGELMDRELARRDVADRSLMDAAAAMRHPRAELGLYDLQPAWTTATSTPPGNSSPARPPKPSARPRRGDR